MEVVCIVPFGNCEVGDVRELPDGAEFSPLYFVEKPKGKGAKSTKLPAQLANSTDEAQGENTDEASTPVVSPEADNESYSAADSEPPANDDSANDEEKDEG